MHWGDLWDRFLSGESDAVEALGTWATVVVAIVAAVFVWRQIAEARKVRVEEAQPNVVGVMESNPNQPQMVEVAFRNFGATPARDVRISVDRPLRRSFPSSVTEEVWLPESLPYLAPGQEWRPTWDFAPGRMTSELRDEDRHEVVITYRGLGSKERKSTAIFDWSAFKGRRFMDQKSVHHAAKALTEIAASMTRWTENNDAIRVVTRDGDRRDDAEREEIEQWRAERRTEARGTKGGHKGWFGRVAASLKARLSGTK